MRALPAVVLFCVSTYGAVSDAAEPASVNVVVNGQIFTGKPVLPATETEFTITTTKGEKVTLQWSQLDPTERKRVQRLFNVASEQKPKAAGRAIEGVRLTLNGGRVVEGLRVPARDRKGQLALQTRELRLVMVPEGEIKSRETFQGNEGDFFTPQEIFERILTDNPPGAQDASAHLDLAKKAEELGLYDAAMRNLDLAGVIDARTLERNKEWRASLATQQAARQAQELYDQLLREMRGGNSIGALATLEKLERNYPNSELRSRWDTLKPQLEAAKKADINKSVVQLFYGIADDVLQKKAQQKVRLDEKGNVVASIPGKQITTKAGDVLRGTLEGTDTGDENLEKAASIKINVKGMSVTIPTKEIVLVQDVDLSVAAKEVEPIFDDLKAWILDLGSPTGLKGQAATRIAKMMEIKEAEVKSIFDTRLNREAEYKDGKLTQAPVFTTLHTASYDRGSWLRDGAKFTPSSGPKVNTLTRYRRVRGPDGREYSVRDEITEQKDKAEAEDSDDPNEWFAVQNAETRLGILRAIMAEKVFRAKSVDNMPCKDCSGKGEIIKMTTLGDVEKERCPRCRGLKALFRVNYE
ncbi:MAG TPA: hypothetical protein VEJ63_01685 [Planctomycetota bacterium]|nr:hypothetical protein [Planctomycetota bacterium]